MIFEFNPLVTVVLNVAGCLLIQGGAAWLFTQLPAHWFSKSDRASPCTFKDIRSHHFLGVRLWKRLLPDGSVWLKGGFSKRNLQGTDPAYLRQFLLETRRGESCHWAALALTPIFFLWNPWWACVIMVIYAVTVNLPCILALRYNRYRLERLLSRKPLHAS